MPTVSPDRTTIDAERLSQTVTDISSLVTVLRSAGFDHEQMTRIVCSYLGGGAGFMPVAPMGDDDD